jgi:hypothetical protein
MRYNVGSTVRLRCAVGAIDEQGMNIELASGMAGTIVTESGDSCVVQFYNQSQTYEVSKTALINSPDGPMTSLYAEKQVGRPDAVIREMFSTRSGANMDTKEATMAVTALTRLKQSLASAKTTENVARLIRATISELRSPQHSSIVRNLNTLLGEVTSASTRLTVRNVQESIGSLVPVNVSAA